MSKKKTEINPKRAENIKKLIEWEHITQGTFAEKTHQTPQNVSRIVQMKQPLTEENAKIIQQAFPKYRLEWLLGYDDSPTNAEVLSEAIQTMNDEAALLHRGFASFAKLSGFRIEVNLIENAKSLDDIFKNMKNHCTVSRDGKTVSFSLAELNAFENELCDYVEFRLLHKMK